MKILIFDTETSGLPEDRNASLLSTNKWPYILQLSYILYDSSKNIILDYSDNLVKIGNDVSINPKSIEIHKITREMCNSNGISIIDILNNFNKVLLQTDLIVGHNLQFDKNMLIVEHIRNKINHNFNPRNIPIPSFCTMENGTTICNLTYKRRDGSLVPKYPKLLELYKHYFNDIPSGLHNAMNDVIVTMRCYYKMQFALDIFECSLDMKNLKEQYFN
mgnify:FL=1